MTNEKKNKRLVYNGIVIGKAKDIDLIWPDLTEYMRSVVFHMMPTDEPHHPYKIQETFLKITGLTYDDIVAGVVVDENNIYVEPRKKAVQA